MSDQRSGAGESVTYAPMPTGWGGLGRVDRMRYRTVSGTGELVDVHAIVAIPDGAAPDTGWPIVAWDHGTSGLGPMCGLTGSAELEANTAQVVAQLIGAGYAVVAPDYLGLSPGSPGPHPYLHTMTEATATIDAVRAARAARPDLAARWAVAGESQGGHAALATGHQATRRAPELDFRGTVAVSPASNIETIFRRVRPGGRELPRFPVGSFAAVLAGMAVAQSEVDVRSRLTPTGRRVVDAIAEAASPDWDAVVAGSAAGDLVSSPLSERDFAAALRRYMKVATAGYDAPILIVHGVRDVRVPLPLTLALLAQFRRGGTRFRFRLVDSGHNDLLLGNGGMGIVVDALAAILPPDEGQRSSSATKPEM